MCSKSHNGRLIEDIENAAVLASKNHVWRNLSIPEKDVEITRQMLYELYKRVSEQTEQNILPDSKIMRSIQKQFHHAIKPSHFTQIYLEEIEQGKLQRNKKLEDMLITSRCRGISGVSVVTIFLSAYPDGQTFSCNWNCHYCPNEPGQPRSYVFLEPGVLRANSVGFDCAEQMWTRIHTYRVNGHPTDKFEVLILGGTIASYPKSYLNTYMRDMYYAANTCMDKSPRRVRLSLEEEQKINTNSDHRIIGVTVETRPDCINPSELISFRNWGVTRVQLGVQHTDDEILKKVNRGHGLKQTINAMKLLRDNCFKVDIHLMPNLPGTTPEKDKEMFDYVLQYLHPDQVKVYPCTTMPFTKILDDYKNGKYIPYGNDDLIDVVLYWKDRVHPWIRNNRIVRDIPDSYIVAGVKTCNQRLEFQEIHKARGGVCRCIRCREAGRHPSYDTNDGKLMVRTYEAQGGKEFFISWESLDEKVLFGFCRLRLSDGEKVFKNLEGKGLIRELHVYGRTKSVGEGEGEVQHRGVGKRLLEEAEKIAIKAGKCGVVIISGVGVKKYYERQGYKEEEDGKFMVKIINLNERNDIMLIGLYVVILILLIVIKINKILINL